MPVDQLSARLRKMRFAPGAIVRCMERKDIALSRNDQKCLPMAPFDADNDDKPLDLGHLGLPCLGVNSQ